MVLLCDYSIRTDQNSTVYILVAFLFRTIRLLELDKSKPLVDPTTEEVIQRETQNRLVWACYFMTTGVDLNSCWREHLPDAPLPCPERDYALGSLSTPVSLQHVEKNPSQELIKSLDLSALTILVMRLRAKTLKLATLAYTAPGRSDTDKYYRLIRKEPSNIDLWDSKSEFLQIIERLNFIRNNVSPQYCIESLQHQLPKNKPSIGATFLFHFLMHAVIFDLTRISLPGFNFPLAKAFINAPTKIRSHYQNLCRSHAVEVSNLIRQGLDYGEGALDDVFCADATVESAKIQIIYAAAVNRTIDVARDTEANLEVHLQFLKRFHQGKAGNSHCVSKEFIGEAHVVSPWL
jgi:hypothetical protein